MAICSDMRRAPEGSYEIDCSRIPNRPPLPCNTPYTWPFDAPKKDLLEGSLRLDPTDARNGKAIHSITQIAAMLRATSSLGTMAAYKTLLEFSPRHEGIFRYEIKQLLLSHQLDVLPALIYSAGSDNPEIAQYAAKWIRDMGDPILSEQLKITNPRRLAQLLEAHTSIKNLDAINVVLSMIDHKSSFVRTAARKCLEVYGNNIKWPVRRLYENTFSKEPPGDKDPMLLLGELTTHFDNQRLSRMNKLFRTGWAAYESGDFSKMAGAYRAILRHEPLYPKGNEMAEGFLMLSDQLLEREQEQDEPALENARLAFRLASPDTPLAKRAKARISWIEVERLRRAKIVDPQMYRNILADDPEHKMAQKMLEQISGPEMTTGRLVLKTLVVSFFVFLAASLTFLRLRG